MQYDWRLYKWNSGSDRTDLTKYLIMPIFLERRCNEQLATGEVILEAMPTSEHSEPFSPKTKFTLERWVGGTLNTYYDYVVDHDDVEHYAGCPEICCHRVHLIEPSVVAQGMHCDNFSLTYELNDVTLNYKTVVSQTEKTVLGGGLNANGYGYERPRGWSAINIPNSIEYWQKYATLNVVETADYTNSFKYQWEGLNALEGLTRNLNGLVPAQISFQMPIIKCLRSGEDNTTDYLFDCPVRCKVIRTTQKNGVEVIGSAKTVKNQLYSPANVANRNDRYMYNIDGKAGLCGTREEEYTEDGGRANYPLRIFWNTQVTNLPAIINTNNVSNGSRTVSFSTDTLTEQDFANKQSYEYKIELTAEPYQSGALIRNYTSTATTNYYEERLGGIIYVRTNADYAFRYTTFNTVPPSSLVAHTSVLCRDLSEEAPPSPFLKKGRPYNCFDLFQKAMLTCDTQIFDNAVAGLDEQITGGIRYPIAVHSDYVAKLKNTTMFESIFENKNLWEVMRQIGHYLHAIPYLEFARDGTDSFVLKFRQLGKTEYGENNTNKSNPITVFNSRALDNFFTQYDAYVTNLFSPQNEVDEWLVCKTSDSSYLVFNDTAELHTKYNITELVAFDIIYKDKSSEPKNALEYVFEKSIYDVLSAKTGFVPAKWSALYYQMGTSKILGLNYVPLTPSGGDGYMALKTIVQRLFDSGATTPDADLKFSDLQFHVRYKTQDALRITQLRPDLSKFVKNSEFEKYPHHEQFYGQQEKIVDSERLSANLWGQLIRVANGVYQCQEYAEFGQEKNAGDLIDIRGQAYYVTECENEYYPDAIFQKVTYSKNFNQLSNIVTIPSEPRFYEVSERSMIRREVRLLDFIKLSTEPPSGGTLTPRYINKSKWHSFIRNLLFCDNGNPELPNFAYTNFKADIWREHYNLPQNDTSVMFPSSEAVLTDNGVTQPKPSASNKAVIVPLLHFPLRNAIVFEWDMDDNFKAADCIDITVGDAEKVGDDAYFALQPVRYCDIYGRADLFDFKLFTKTEWDKEQIQRLPFAEKGDFVPSNSDSLILIPDNLSIGLDKDNREALSFNYQLNLLHEPRETDKEDFVVFPNLFGEKKGRLKAVLLNKEVSMLNDVVEMDTRTIVANTSYTFENTTSGLKINFVVPSGIDVAEVKSIVLYDTENGENFAYLAKNVAKLETIEQKLQSWYIYPAFNDFSF